jgi:hypothetical protein
MEPCQPSLHCVRIRSILRWNLPKNVFNNGVSCGNLIFDTAFRFFYAGKIGRSGNTLCIGSLTRSVVIVGYLLAPYSFVRLHVGSVINGNCSMVTYWQSNPENFEVYPPSSTPSQRQKTSSLWRSTARARLDASAISWGCPSLSIGKLRVKVIYIVVVKLAKDEC